MVWISFTDWPKLGLGVGSAPLGGQVRRSQEAPPLASGWRQPVAFPHQPLKDLSSPQTMFPCSLRNWVTASPGSRCLLPGFTCQVRKAGCAWKQSVATQPKVWELSYAVEYSKISNWPLGSPTSRAGQNCQNCSAKVVKMKPIFKPELTKLDQSVHCEYKHTDTDFLLQ